MAQTTEILSIQPDPLGERFDHRNLWHELGYDPEPVTHVRDHSSFRLPSPASGRTKTNPVWALTTQFRRSPLRSRNPQAADDSLRDWVNQARECGVYFPDHLIEEYDEFFVAPNAEKRLPRVVGLLVKKSLFRSGKKLGLVTPLRVLPSTQSRISHYLPFDEPDIRNGLHNLVLASGAPCSDIVPELLGFDVQQDLNEPASGASMDIAALLAIIDCFSGHQVALLSGACAVVYPEGERLVEVESIEVKIGAFVREYHHGSLLVCHTETRLPEKYINAFSEVWRVDTYGSLAEQLAKNNLLAPLLRHQRISSSQVFHAKGYLDYLGATEGAVSALQFALRLERAVDAMPASHRLPLRARQQLLRYLEDGYRHVGDAPQALRFSQSSLELHQENAETESFESIAESCNRLASAMFDAHEFEEGLELLSPVYQRLMATPELSSGEVRAHVANTLGRLMIILERDGWEPLLRGSLRLQREVEPESVSRTQCYLLRGLIRTRSLEAAHQEFVQLSLDGLAPSNAYLPFYAQEYVRQGGKQTEFVQQILACPISMESHALGLFLVSRGRTHAQHARQISGTGDGNQSLLSAISDFHAAIRCFDKDGGTSNPSSLANLFAALMRLTVASLTEQAAEMHKSLGEVNLFLEQHACPSMNAWYRPYLSSPLDRDGMDQLLNRVPYF